MPDKVPLGGGGQEPPDLNQNREPEARPGRRKKRQKSNFEIQRDRAKLWDEISGYLRLIIIIGLCVAGYYAYRYFTDPEYMRNDRFAVMEKILIKPTAYKDHSQTTSLGAPSSVVYPPKYVFKCLGDDTRDYYYVVVDEHLYYDVPLRTIFGLEDIERYIVFNSLMELEEHYGQLEQPPTTKEEEDSGVKKIFENLKDLISGN